MRLVFREVNDRVRELADTFASSDGSLELVCECGRADCVERIRISRAEYDRLREDARQFVLKTEHCPPDGTVVLQGAGYVVLTDTTAG